MTQEFHRLTRNQVRQRRVRAKLFGTAQRPRLSVFRSNKYLQVQAINDAAHKTLFGMHSKSQRTAKVVETKTQTTSKLATAVAAELQKRKISTAILCKHYAQKALQYRIPMAEQYTQVSEFDEKVIQISRVSKKTKGGSKMGFSVLMVVGDRKGKVGVGLGKAKDVMSAIQKGIKKAKKHLITVPIDGTTIPFRVLMKKGAGQVLLKPAPKGSGVIAGGPVRAVVEAAGIRDISSKILGTQNQASNVYTTFAALTQISQIVKLKNISLKSLAQVESEEVAKMTEEQKRLSGVSQTAVEKPAKRVVAKKKTGITKKKSTKK